MASTSVTLRPFRATGAGSGSPLPSRSARTVNQKVEPRPEVLSMPISPPMPSTSRLQIARPRPVPPSRRRALWSTWVKALNRFFCRSGDRPLPVSVMVILTTASAPRSSSSMARTTIDPRSVNLIALLTRLVSTWRMRSGSPSRPVGTSE